MTCIIGTLCVEFIVEVAAMPTAFEFASEEAAFPMNNDAERTTEEITASDSSEANEFSSKTGEVNAYPLLGMRMAINKKAGKKAGKKTRMHKAGKALIRHTYIKARHLFHHFQKKL